MTTTTFKSLERILSKLDNPWIWALVFLLIYSWSTGPFLWDGTVFNYHSWQAKAWLQGHLWLPNVSDNKLDLTPYAGHWYSAFPPLPAIIMLPFVIIWGLDANQVMVSVGLGALNIGLWQAVLTRLDKIHHLSRLRQAALVVLFGLGTVVWQSVIQGTVWQLAHTCALSLLLIALLVGLEGEHLVVVGILIGLAGLARPTVWLTLLYWFVLIYRYYCQEIGTGVTCWWSNPILFVKSQRERLTHLLIGPGLALIITLSYNWLRFHSLTDFGYNNMQVGPNIRGELLKYGQFNLYFLPKNFFYAFLNLPGFHRHLPFITYDLNGNSLIFLTPAFLLVPLAGRDLWRTSKPWFLAWPFVLSIAAALGGFTTLGALLLYFNTGQIQLGYRFVQDCLPLLILLIALNWRKGRRWTVIGLILIGLSVFFNFYGMMWYQGYFPNIFGPVNK